MYEHPTLQGYTLFSTMVFKTMAKAESYGRRVCGKHGVPYIVEAVTEGGETRYLFKEYCKDE